MSYTVLARRYRSNTFDEIIGQEHIAQTLKKAITSNRVAHAYLFCGTRGTGKTSMARILAKSLNCHNSDKPTTEPCGKCSSCVAIARGDDMDVTELDAASNRGIDEVRKLIENSRYSPANSRFKIYIIDEVHGLTKDAFNALLKVLEEPAEHVKFILCTTEPEKVLPTILSRCQRYDFRNIPTREIADHLKDICKQEKIKAEDDALLLVAKAGSGSMRDALSLLDRLLSVGEKTLTVEMIEQLLGMPRAQVIFDLVEAISTGDVNRTLTSAGKLIASGLAADSLTAALIDHLRNLMIIRAVGAKSDLLELPGLSIDEMQTQADCFDIAALSQDIALLEELRRSLRTSQAGRALLDATLVRMTLADQFTNVSALLNGTASPAPVTPALKKNAEPPVTVSSSEEDEDALPAPGKVWDTTGPSLSELLKQQERIANTQPTTQANVEPVDASDLSAVMSRLRSAIHRDNPGIDGFLAHGKFIGVSDGVATIEVPSAAATMLDRNGKRELIQDGLSALLNQTVGVKFQVGEDAPVITKPQPIRREAVRNSPIPRGVEPSPPPGVRITPELREQLRNDEPLIKALMDDLGAEIVRVE